MCVRVYVFVFAVRIPVRTAKPAVLLRDVWLVQPHAFVQSAPNGKKRLDKCEGTCVRTKVCIYDYHTA